MPLAARRLKSAAICPVDKINYWNKRMLSLFFSYSHADEKYRDELEIHLAILKRENVISVWHDRRIDAGSSIDDEIDSNLDTADIVLLMVSANFLASDYCYENELLRALENHKNAKSIVIPVIVHPCDWKKSIFGHLRATPTDGQPISKFPNIHDAYLCVVKDIRKAVKKLGVSGAQPKVARTEGLLQTTIANPRSSNLRAKREFTDKERDDFLEFAFEYLSNYFENSLDELKSRNSQIDSRFTRIDRNTFTASVYRNGKKKSSCSVWIAGPTSFGGDIRYANSDKGPGNSFNESLSIKDDGYSHFLEPLGMGLSVRNHEKKMTEQGGAEYFWSMFMHSLQ